jgi:hypothetical protein
MNQLFSPRRFWLLLRLHYAENGRNYLISSGVLVGLMLLLMTPILFSKVHSQLLSILHILALFTCVLLGGSLMSSMAFLPYSSPSKGIPALMVPASRLEKFLVAWLFYILLAVFFLLLFWTLHVRFIEIANQRLPPNGPEYHPIPKDPATFLTYLFFLIQAGVFLGSIYFPKYAYVKSAAALMATGLFAFVFNYLLANHFLSYPNFLVTYPFTSWDFVHLKRYVVEFPETTGRLIWVFLVLLLVSLWGVAFVRLKEKEL